MAKDLSDSISIKKKAAQIPDNPDLRFRVPMPVGLRGLIPVNSLDYGILFIEPSEPGGILVAALG